MSARGAFPTKGGSSQQQPTSGGTARSRPFGGTRSAAMTTVSPPPSPGKRGPSTATAPAPPAPMPSTKTLLKATPLQEIVNAQPSILVDLRLVTTASPHHLRDFTAGEKERLINSQRKYDMTTKAITEECNKQAFREQETRTAGETLTSLAETHMFQLAQRKQARLEKQSLLAAKIRAAQATLIEAQKNLADDELALEAQLSREAESKVKLEEAREKHKGVQEMLDCRNKLIELEEAKQTELCRQRDGARKLVEELDKKKQDQMARLGEIRQRVDETKEEELATQQELEDRQSIIEKLKKDIRLLKKVQGKK